MNDEKKTTEAEQTKPGDMTDSIERMKAVLDAVEHEVHEARFLVAGMESCPLKWRTLSHACDRIHDLTCWENYMKDPGVFRTSKEIIDFVTANPPLGEVKDAPTPLDPSAPKMVQGGVRPKADEDHMSRPEAVNILCRMATSRKVNVKGVIALQIGVRSLLKRHFDRQRNWARRREQAANAEKGDSCHE